MIATDGTGPSDEAEFLVGEAAQLEPLRAAIATQHETTIASALQQILRHDTNDSNEASASEERILVPLTACRVTLQTADDDDDNMPEKEDDDNDAETTDNHGDNHEDQHQETQFQNILGKVVVTSERVLFVATDESPTSARYSYDLSVDAECIELHAQSTDPVSVYLQINNMAGSEDDDRPTEVVIIPERMAAPAATNHDTTVHDDDSVETVCEQLFSKLTELVSLHPVSPNDGGGGGGMMGSMMNMMAMMNGGPPLNGLIVASDSVMTGGRARREEDQDDMIVAAPLPSNPHQFSDGEEEEEDDDYDDPGASAEERQAMLDRLDSLLVVKPELELKEHQFDDADEVEGDKAGNDNSNTGESSKTKDEGGQFDDADDASEDALL